MSSSYYAKQSTTANVSKLSVNFAAPYKPAPKQSEFAPMNLQEFYMGGPGSKLEGMDMIERIYQPMPVSYSLTPAMSDIASRLVNIEQTLSKPFPVRSLAASKKKKPRSRLHPELSYSSYKKGPNHLN